MYRVVGSDQKSTRCVSRRPLARNRENKMTFQNFESSCVAKNNIVWLKMTKKLYQELWGFMEAPGWPGSLEDISSKLHRVCLWHDWVPLFAQTSATTTVRAAFREKASHHIWCGTNLENPCDIKSFWNFRLFPIGSMGHPSAMCNLIIVQLCLALWILCTRLGRKIHPTSAISCSLMSTYM